MKCRLFQEKLHTILRINEGKNENTNEYIWKLMTILTFRVHVNLKSVVIFYLIQQLKIFFKLPKSVWKATPGHEGRAMPPACPPGYGPAIPWEKLETFEEFS